MTIVVNDERAKYHWTLTATNDRAGRESGNRVRISGFEVWRIGEDGLIAESRGHFDARSTNASWNEESSQSKACRQGEPGCALKGDGGGGAKLVEQEAGDG